MPRIFINGSYKDVSEEEALSLQQKANQAGVPEPSTPVGGAVVGANPDQAKMIGTPAQQQGVAKRIDIAPEQTLAQQERVEGPRQTAGEAEQQVLSKSQELQKLGYLGSRVDQIIQEQFSQQSDQEAQLEVNRQALAGLAEEQQAGFQENLVAYQQAVASGDQQAVNTALVNLNNTSGGMLQSPDDVQQYLQNISQSTGSQIAGQITDDLQLSQLNLPDMGLAEEDLSQILGPNWQNMTVPELQQTIANLKADEFNRAEGLKTELADPATSASRRREIMREMKDLGQIGIATAEAEVANIERAVEEADIVTFNGQEMSIADVLDDDNISKTIEQYLALPEDSEAKAQIAEQFGEDFTDWVDSHSQALTELASGMATTSEAFSELQQANKEANVIDNVGSISEDLMKDLFPDFGGWSDKDYSTELKGQEWYKLLNMDIKDIPVANKQAFLDTLNKTRLDPEFAEELKTLNAADARNLMNNPDKFANYVGYRSQFINPEDFTEEQQQDSDFLLDYIFGKDVNPSELQDKAEQQRILKATGMPNNYDLYSSIVDESGKLNVSDMLGYIKTRDPGEEIKPLGEFIDNPTTSSRYDEVSGAESQTAPSWFGDVYKYLKGEQSPSISSKDITTMATRDPNFYNNLTTNSPVYTKLMDDAARSTFIKQIQTKVKDTHNLAFSKVPSFYATITKPMSKFLNAFSTGKASGKDALKVMQSIKDSELAYKTALDTLKAQIKTASGQERIELEKDYKTYKDRMSKYTVQKKKLVGMIDKILNPPIKGDLGVDRALVPNDPDWFRKLKKM